MTEGGVMGSCITNVSEKRKGSMMEPSGTPMLKVEAVGRRVRETKEVQEKEVSKVLTFEKEG